MSSALVESMLQGSAPRTDRGNGKAVVALAFLAGLAAAALVSGPLASVYHKEPVSLWGATPARAPAASRMPGMIPSNLRAGRLPQIPRAYSGARVTVRADDIDAKVKKMIADNLSVDEAKVVPEASFIGDLGADSLDAVELLMALEEEFGVEIPEEEAQKLTTVKAVMDYAKANAK